MKIGLPRVGRPIQQGLTEPLKRSENWMADTLAIAGRTGRQRAVLIKWLSDDTRFHANGAVGAGLVDEIVERPLLPRALQSTATPASPSKDPTEQENLFNLFLAGFGTLTMRDRAEFRRGLR